MAAARREIVRCWDSRGMGGNAQVRLLFNTKYFPTTLYLFLFSPQIFCCITAIHIILVTWWKFGCSCDVWKRRDIMFCNIGTVLSCFLYIIIFKVIVYMRLDSNSLAWNLLDFASFTEQDLWILRFKLVSYLYFICKVSLIYSYSSLSRIWCLPLLYNQSCSAEITFIIFISGLPRFDWLSNFSLEQLPNIIPEKYHSKVFI